MTPETTITPETTMTPESREWIYKRDVIVEVTTNFMFPLVLLFGLYIMMGTGGTGGGFQGGTILATAFILYITVYGTELGRKKMPESTNALFKSLGLFFYNGAGQIAVLFSLAAAQWINLSAFWPVADITGTAGVRGFLVSYMISIGIGLTVMAAFVSQYFDLAWKEEGESGGR